jgi:hypothetical protein
VLLRCCGCCCCSASAAVMRLLLKRQCCGYCSAPAVAQCSGSAVLLLLPQYCCSTTSAMLLQVQCFCGSARVVLQVMLKPSHDNCCICIQKEMAAPSAGIRRCHLTKLCHSMIYMIIYPLVEKFFVEVVGGWRQLTEPSLGQTLRLVY